MNEYIAFSEWQLINELEEMLRDGPFEEDDRGTLLIRAVIARLKVLECLTN